MNEDVKPESWAAVAIEDCLLPYPNNKKIRQGWSPQCESYPAKTLATWGVLKTTAIQDGYFLDHENKQLPEHLEPRTHLEVEQGDILITCAGPRSRCGITCLVRATRKKLLISGKMYQLRADLRICEPRFLEAFLRGPKTKQQIDELKTGMSDSGLNLTHDRFKTLEIPLPPLAEQKRIADKLEAVLGRADACRARLDRVPALLKRFRQSVLAAATSGKLTEEWRKGSPEYAETFVEYPYSHTINGSAQWTQSTFGDLCDLIGGSQPPKSTFTQVESPSTVRLIQIRDYKSDKHIVFIPKNLARRFCSKTDVMIGRYGPPIFQILRGLEGAYNVALMKAQPKDKRLDLDYLYYWLQQEVLLRYVEAGSDRTAGQDGIRKDLVERYPFFLPPLPEQQEIVRRVEALFAFADRIESRLATARKTVERLTPATLAKAFRGELVPQDPADEPASTLLERLHAQSDPATAKPKRGRRAKSTSA